MIGGTVETSASFGARYAPLSYPTITHASDTEREAHVPGIARCAASSTFRRHSSTVRAVCVNAPVRICAGGDQRWSSLPRQLSRSGVVGNRLPSLLETQCTRRVPHFGEFAVFVVFLV